MSHDAFLVFREPTDTPRRDEPDNVIDFAAWRRANGHPPIRPMSRVRTFEEDAYSLRPTE